MSTETVEKPDTITKPKLHDGSGNDDERLRHIVEKKKPNTDSRGFKKIAFLTLCSLLILSMGVRAYFITSGSPEAAVSETAIPATDNAGGLAPNALVDGEPGFLPPSGQSPTSGTTTTGPTPEPSQIERAIPYLTEGSFFALIGFALGYASRKVVKVGLILLALVFAGLQGLSYLEVIHIEGIPGRGDMAVFTNCRGGNVLWATIICDNTVVATGTVINNVLMAESSR